MSTTPEHELYPRLAIAIPHPENPEAWAIDMRTGTLPGVRIDHNEMTRERVALHLARTINNDPRHSVDRAVSAPPQSSLYIMKPAAHARLARPYSWQEYDAVSVRAAYAQIASPGIEFWPERRAIVERPAMQALSMLTIAEALGTPDERRIVQSFFFEEPGMYGLDLLSDIDIR